MIFALVLAALFLIGVAMIVLGVVFSPWLLAAVYVVALALAALAWWWVHTWEFHAWSNEPYAFWRFTWRRVRGSL